jgi:hypothetical protein
MMKPFVIYDFSPHPFRISQVFSSAQYFVHAKNVHDMSTVALYLSPSLSSLEKTEDNMKKTVQISMRVESCTPSQFTSITDGVL